MCLKLNMSTFPNIIADVTESSIWNTMITSRHELLDDIDDSDDNDEEEEDDDLSLHKYDI